MCHYAVSCSKPGPRGPAGLAGIARPPYGDAMTLSRTRLAERDSDLDSPLPIVLLLRSPT